MLILALALLVVADPTAEALALGKRLAETGEIAGLLPAMVEKDREQLINAHPEWSDADKAAFRKTADRVAAKGTGRLMEAIGRVYAEKLSIEDLRRLVAFQESDAGKRWRAVTPAAVMEGARVAGEMDFQKDVLAAFCAETGKGCNER